MTRARKRAGRSSRPGRVGPARSREPGSVRVSAGRWKGRKLDVPPRARPTSARAREALFDILGPSVAGSRWLDLYAGSGAVGLEASSRGAASVVLVDSDAAILVRNVARLRATGSDVRVIGHDAGDALRTLAHEGATFDVVFADPPYGERLQAEFFALAAGRLAPGGTFVLQAPPGACPEFPPALAVSAPRAYGRNAFWFARAKGGGMPPF